MRIRHSIDQRDSKLQLSAMIDIVFLLLIFFVMTFKIVAPESDLHVSTPHASDAGPAPFDLPHVVRLDANRYGELTGVWLDDEALADFDQLRDQVRRLIEQASAADNDFIVECEDHLNYRHAIDAMTAISGYVGEDGRVVPLARNVSFARPRDT